MKLALLFTMCCGASAAVIIAPLLPGDGGVFKNCKEGTYALHGTCVACAAGHGSLDGASACYRCPRGQMSVPVPPNQPESGHVCRQCPPGHYAANEGSTTCIMCPVKTASAAVGATSKATCVKCANQHRIRFTPVGSSVCLNHPN
jgi:hypothetical protein